jgi:hypothetical protein
VTLAVGDVAGAAPLASPALSGNPTAPTPATSDSDTSIATTAFVKAQAYAPLASPVLTGNPQAPTQASADNDTSIATTAFVKNQAYAPLASPTFTGDPKAPTPATADNDTSLATTAFVRAAMATYGPHVLGRYTNVFSMVPFGGLPGNGVRYNPATWAGLVVPAGTHYATVMITADGRGTGAAQANWFMTASISGGAYTEVASDAHNNNGDATIDLSGYLLTNVDLLGASTLGLKLEGSASNGLASVSTLFTTVRVTFMGR